MRLSSLFIALVLVARLGAADPVPVVPNPFPVLPVVPTDPPSPPSPDAPTLLPDEWLFIVKSDAEFVLRASPKGKVDIIRASSPQIGGKFVGGNGKFKLETFKEKNVAIVMKKPGASGAVELIYSPAGAKDESSDIYRMVQLGTAPQPPPVDPTVPDVQPPVVVKSFRVIIVYESGDTLTPEQNGIIYGNVLEEFLTATCTGGKLGWKRRDKDTSGKYDAAMQAVWDEVKAGFAAKTTKTPAVVVQVNSTIHIVPLESTPAATVAVLKKLSEGK